MSTTEPDISADELIKLIKEYPQEYLITHKQGNRYNIEYILLNKKELYFLRNRKTGERCYPSRILSSVENLHNDLDKDL